MKKLTTILATILIIITANAQYINGKCIRVVDGDTYIFAVNNGDTVKVRDAYCNTPENKNSVCKLEQPYALDATMFARNILLNQSFEIKIVGYDLYGRTLAVAKVNNILYHKKAISDGIAWSYKGSGINYRLQKRAMKKRVGLWQDNEPINPSKWLQIYSTKK